MGSESTHADKGLTDKAPEKPTRPVPKSQEPASHAPSGLALKLLGTWGRKIACQS